MIRICLALVVAACAGGCGASTCSSGGNDGGPAAGLEAGSACSPGASAAATLHVNIAFTGQLPISGSADYVTPDSTSAANSDCVALANDWLSQGAVEINGRDVVNLDLGDVDGNGNFELGSEEQITLDDPQVSDADGDDYSNISAENPAQSVKVNPDGSGAFTFSAWTNAYDQGEAGTESWTCSH